LTDKNSIAQWEIVVCYFLFSDVTGQARSPGGRGQSSSTQTISPPRRRGDYGEGENAVMIMVMKIFVPGACMVWVDR